MPLIKHYSNRKLYNMEDRRYVSLEDVARLIRAGGEVQVVDHETGADLTAVILTQIIVEQERKRTGFLPRSVLIGLIRAGGGTANLLRHGLAAPLDLLRQVDEEIERRVGQLVGAGELAEEDGFRLRAQLLSHDEPRPAESGEARLVERALSARDVLTRADLAVLTRQIDALAVQLGQLLDESKEAR